MKLINKAIFIYSGIEICDNSNNIFVPQIRYMEFKKAACSLQAIIHADEVCSQAVGKQIS